MFLDHLAVAFGTVFQGYNLAYLALAVLIGLVAGALPGISITMAIVLTLPFTFGLSPAEGLTIMMGVLVGGLSGGLMSATLMGIPGTASAVATTFDGFPLARQGRPGFALGLGIWSSMFGGLIGAVVLIATASALAQVGLEFGPWGYFSLVVFALTVTASLSGDNLVKGLLSGAVGLVVVTIGEDAINGVARLDFGIDALRQGFDYLPILIGLFAFSQLLKDIEDRAGARRRILSDDAPKIQVNHLEVLRTIFRHWRHVIRSALIGVMVGILPAAGASISNILAYDQAKKFSKTPEKFGTGTPEGVIASESSNNATAGGDLTVLMALGIPGDSATAVMLGALLIHNIVPGPNFISEQPVLAYSIYIAFILAHFVTVAIQFWGMRVFLAAMRVPLYILVGIIFFLCALGVFAINNVTFDIWVMFGFGVLGYGMRLLGFPLVPMILGLILGTLIELNLNRALSINPDPMLFVTTPWSLFFLILAAFSVVFPYYQRARGKRRWAAFFSPALTAGLAVPMMMMPGTFRPLLAVGLLVLAALLLWRNLRQPLDGPSPAPARGLQGD